MWGRLVIGVLGFWLIFCQITQCMAFKMPLPSSIDTGAVNYQLWRNPQLPRKDPVLMVLPAPASAAPPAKLQ